MTEILPATDARAVDRAVALLERGDVVVLPTDTVYGIAASIATASGIEKIYDVKARSRGKPVMIYVAGFEQFRQVVVYVDEQTIGALRNIWPGAMAGIFLKNDEVVPDYVTAGIGAVAVRIPDNRLCLDLVERVGYPVAMTSANVSGMVTHDTAQDVARQLGPQVPLVLDGGPSQRSNPSTLVDFTGAVPRLLRSGALSVSRIRQFLPDLEWTSETEWTA